MELAAFPLFVMAESNTKLQLVGQHVKAFYLFLLCSMFALYPQRLCTQLSLKDGYNTTSYMLCSRQPVALTTHLHSAATSCMLLLSSHNTLFGAGSSIAAAGADGSSS